MYDSDVWRADLESLLNHAVKVAIIALLLACAGCGAVGNGILVKIKTNRVKGCFWDAVRRLEFVVDFCSNDLRVRLARTVGHIAGSDGSDQGLLAIVDSTRHGVKIQRDLPGSSGARTQEVRGPEMNLHRDILIS